MFNPLDSDSLIGKPIEASVGEPWNFFSASGENRFTGEIIAVSAPSDNKPWFLCEITPFEQGKLEITQVVATNRYKGAQHFLELIQQGQSVVSNFIFRPDEKRGARH